MSKQPRYKNPFAMGNLNDLMYARENDDLEYLKEWTRRAVETYDKHRDIQLKAFESLIRIKDTSSESVEAIRQMLKEA